MLVICSPPWPEGFHFQHVSLHADFAWPYHAMVVSDPKSLARWGHILKPLGVVHVCGRSRSPGGWGRSTSDDDWSWPLEVSEAAWPCLVKKGGGFFCCCSSSSSSYYYFFILFLLLLLLLVVAVVFSFAPCCVLQRVCISTREVPPISRRATKGTCYSIGVVASTNK